MKVLNYATPDVLRVEPSDSIDRAIQLMEDRGIHHLVVTDGGRAVGMISDRDILVSTGWMFAFERRGGSRAAGVSGPTRVEQIMSRPIVALSPAGSAGDAAAAMIEHKIGAVPIMREGELHGIVTETDLLRWLDELAFGDNEADQLLAGEVRDLMPARLISVGPDVPLEEVIDIFRRFHVRHVPVATTARTLVGMISDRDVRRALGWASVRDSQAQAAGRLPEAQAPETAADVMHSDVRTIEQGARLRAALRRMLELRVHALPVVDGDRLVGIVTMTDFIRLIAREELL
jgi:CBS domain-containing protein